MEEPCFDFLRTKETLGYSVSSCWRNTSGVLGFTITVETQATKFRSEAPPTVTSLSAGEKTSTLSGSGRSLSLLSAQSGRSLSLSSEWAEPVSPLSSEWEEPVSPLSSEWEEPVSPLSSEWEEPVSPLSSEWEEPVSPLSSEWEEPVSPLSSEWEEPVSPLSSEWEEPVFPLSSEWEEPVSPLSSEWEESVSPLSSEWEEPVFPLSSEWEESVSPLSSEWEEPVFPLSSEWEEPVSPLSSEWEEPVFPLSSEWEEPVFPLSSDSEWVESKIAAFLDSCGALVSSLGAVLFRSHVEALVQLKSAEDTNLGEEVNHNWREILKQEYVFDRKEEEVRALLSFSQNDLVSCFREIVNHGRKLSVHVVGFGEQEGDSPGGGAVSYLHDDAIELHFLPLPLPWLQQATPIRDISAFTAALPLHPLHKVKCCERFEMLKKINDGLELLDKEKKNKPKDPVPSSGKILLVKGEKSETE
uniref:p53 tetramerisation domain-containing protein n=1 Tax=Knipowitschia caucasica TaxID=637954 RepID=A0AAV2KUD5_KNICA